MNKKIISGGQTGADQAALDAAIKLGIPHGGAIFSLADAAFAAASNSYGQVAVALNVSLNYLSAVPVGARLYAEATEESKSRRIALYRLSVTADDGTPVALCHGTVYRKNQSLE